MIKRLNPDYQLLTDDSKIIRDLILEDAKRDVPRFATPIDQITDDMFDEIIGNLSFYRNPWGEEHIDACDSVLGINPKYEELTGEKIILSSEDVMKMRENGEFMTEEEKEEAERRISEEKMKFIEQISEPVEGFPDFFDALEEIDEPKKTYDISMYGANKIASGEVELTEREYDLLKRVLNPENWNNRKGTGGTGMICITPKSKSR